MKRTVISILGFTLLLNLASANQKRAILGAGNREVIPIEKGKSAVDAIEEYMKAPGTENGRSGSPVKSRWTSIADRQPFQ